jgi:hypothetical protein
MVKEMKVCCLTDLNRVVLETVAGRARKFRIRFYLGHDYREGLAGWRRSQPLTSPRSRHPTPSRSSCRAERTQKIVLLRAGDVSGLSLFRRVSCQQRPTNPAFRDAAEERITMPILYACVLIEMLKRSSVPSLTTIASLAALQSAAYG